VVFVHGGLGPELTWERQHPLAARWTLLIPTRRAYPGSAPAERQDFERDARDLSPLLNEGAPLVGYSYGGLGCAIAAGQDPDRVLSLTMIEVPLYLVAPGDPEVEAFAAAGDAFLSGEANAETEVEFLANAGLGPDTPPQHAKEIARATEAARGGRSPREANPDLEAIVDAGIPTMVVSGNHHTAIESLCDALADRLHARREIVSGAGHAVPRASGFNDVLEGFLRESEGTARSRTA